MIADTGLAALWLAAALALVQLASGARPVAVAQSVIAAVAAIALIGDLADFAIGVATALLAVSARGKSIRPDAALGLLAYGVVLSHQSVLRLPLAAICLTIGFLALHRRARWSRRLPSANAGLAIALGGSMLLIVGAFCDRILIDRTVTIARPGDRLNVGPWLVQFATVNPVAGPNFTAIEAELRVSRGSGVSLLRPQARRMVAPPNDSSKSAVETFWNGRLSATLSAAPHDSRELRLEWQPFITLAWLGGGLVALGGLIVLTGKFLRQWRRRPPPRRRYE